MLLGGICGMLVNYLSDILPTSHHLTRPQCSKCHQPYPIIDYALARRCQHCGSAPSLRSRIVLISGPLIGLLLYFFPIPIFTFWETLPLLLYMGVVMVIDIEHRLVLLETSIVGLILCTIYGIVLHGFKVTILGALGGFVIMLLFYLSGVVFNLIMGKIKNQKITEVAFGFGDVSLGTILGSLVGWPATAGVIIIALVAFGVFSLFYILELILSKRYRAFTNALPFAPFLILSTILLFYL
jgi:hypothetical protein